MLALGTGRAEAGGSRPFSCRRRSRLRHREETDGKELSEEVRVLLIKKDGVRKKRGEAKQI